MHREVINNDIYFKSIFECDQVQVPYLGGLSLLVPHNWQYLVVFGIRKLCVLKKFEIFSIIFLLNEIFLLDNILSLFMLVPHLHQR